MIIVIRESEHHFDFVLARCVLGFHMKVNETMAECDVKNDGRIYLAGRLCTKGTPMMEKQLNEADYPRNMDRRSSAARLNQEQEDEMVRIIIVFLRISLPYYMNVSYNSYMHFRTTMI